MVILRIIVSLMWIYFICGILGLWFAASNPEMRKQWRAASIMARIYAVTDFILFWPRRFEE